MKYHSSVSKRKIQLQCAELLSETTSICNTSLILKSHYCVLCDIINRQESTGGQTPKMAPYKSLLISQPKLSRFFVCRWCRCIL